MTNMRKYRYTCTGIILTTFFALPCFAQTTTLHDMMQPQQPQQQAPQAVQQPQQSQQPQQAQEMPQLVPNNAAPQTAPSVPVGRSPAAAADTSSPAFFELTPELGAIHVAPNQSPFTIGTNFAFRIIRDLPLYFEPSIFFSFVSNSTTSATLFHFDAGVRYDFTINNTPFVPFLKGALGPTIVSNSQVAGVTSDYFNMLLGGGLKVLINKSIDARVDLGLAVQNSTTGAYFLGGVGLAL
jgi:hypothetical protein